MLALGWYCSPAGLRRTDYRGFVFPAIMSESSLYVNYYNNLIFQTFFVPVQWKISKAGKLNHQSEILLFKLHSSI